MYSLSSLCLPYTSVFAKLLTCIYVCNMSHVNSHGYLTVVMLLFGYRLQNLLFVVAFYSDICQLAADAGPCLASQTRYYYDPNRRSCRQFTYGGCLGNENNFASAESCERHCVDIASRPSDEPVTMVPDSKFEIC